MGHLLPWAFWLLPQLQVAPGHCKHPGLVHLVQSQTHIILLEHVELVKMTQNVNWDSTHSHPCKSAAQRHLARMVAQTHPQTQPAGWQGNIIHRDHAI